jgi:hypothetical protein
MKTMLRPRVRMDVVVECGTVWLGALVPSPDEVCRRILDESPFFSSQLETLAVRRVRETVGQGIHRLSEGLADAFTLCPLMAKDLLWQPGPGRLKVQAAAGVWTLVGPAAAGMIEPLAFREICRLYYEVLMVPYAEAFLERDLAGLVPDDPQTLLEKASAGVEKCFRVLHERFSLEPFQEKLLAELQRGTEPADAYQGVAREIRSTLGHAASLLSPRLRLID